MPTPIFTIRLEPKVQRALSELGKAYGAPNGRAFAREILETVTSGDPSRVAEFIARMAERLGGQLALSLPVDTPAKVDARSTRKARKTRRRRRPRERTT